MVKIKLITGNISTVNLIWLVKKSLCPLISIIQACYCLFNTFNFK